MVARSLICGIVSLIAGVLFVSVGIGGPVLISEKITQGLAEQLSFATSSSPGFERWRNNTYKGANPMNFTFYVWNVLNEKEFLAGAQKLKVEEVGPYVYEDKQVGFDFIWDNSSELLEYTEYQYYLFDRKNTPSHLDPKTDKVTVVNVAFMGVLAFLSPSNQSNVNDEWWELLAWDLIGAYTNASLFQHLTPHELIWGHVDPTLELLSKLDPSVNPVVQLQMNYSSPSAATAANNRFTVNTGVANLNQLDTLVKWKNSPTVSVWGSEEANRISGRQGMNVGPETKKLGDSAGFWIPELYRNIPVLLNETIEVYGVSMLKGYTMDDKTLASSDCTRYPHRCNEHNAGWYQYGPPGVYNLSSIHFGAAVFGSNPHFYDADPSYSKGLEGLHPAPQYKTWIWIEPYTGSVTGGAKMLQINVQLHELPDWLIYTNVSNVFAPLMWASQGGVINEANAELIKNSISGPLLAKSLVLWIGVVIGVLLLIVALGCFAMYCRNRRTQSGYDLLKPSSAEPSLNWT